MGSEKDRKARNTTLITTIGLFRSLVAVVVVVVAAIAISPHVL
jgi:hypothetical protein